MKSEAIRCRCGKVICVRYGDTVTVKFSGRRISVTRPQSLLIVCEKCKAENKIIQEAQNHIDKE